MKSFALLLSAATLALAADSTFETGQAARALIGQTNFTAQDPNNNKVKNGQVGLSGRDVTILGAVGGIALGGGTLLVTDSNRVNALPINNRVLIYRNITQTVPPATGEVPAALNDRCPVCVGVADNVVGQSDFSGTDIALTRSGLRLPTAVATDGTHLVISDTENNRVLIWNTIPTANGVQADLVLGQPDFTSNKSGLSAKNFRGPQGVWIQGNRLFVADTQNNRILIWNSFPTSNQQAADVVLGQPNFTANNGPDPRFPESGAHSNNLYTPVHVSSDGQRLYVTDLGFNRVLIWNSIPTSNQAPADIAVGQLDLDSGFANNSTRLCKSNGTDPNNNNAPTYPARCYGTLSFPRAAVSDGRRLFIADGGNDRVMVYETIPTTSAKNADAILGQPDEFTDQVSSENVNAGQSAAADVLRTPLGLAWDSLNQNLYVSDPFNRRVLVFSPALSRLPYAAVRNAFNQDVFAVGHIDVAGKATSGNTVTVKIADNSYTYTVKDNDTLTSIINGLVAAINGSNNGAGDPLLLAIPNAAINSIILTARQNGDVGTTVNVSATTSDKADVIVAVTKPQINGQDAAKIAPGSIVTIRTNDKITDQSLVAATIQNPQVNGLPPELGGVQVYFDGIRAPIFAVDPNQVTVQVPFELADGTNSSAYIRSTALNGVTTTNAVALPVVAANPGILTNAGDYPRPAVAYHATSNAAGTVLITGTTKTGDTATVTIEDRAYTYTLVDGDTLDSVRDKLINLINANNDEKVSASPAYQYDRIILKAKVAGPDGNGITYSASTGGSGGISLTPSGGALCCASQAGAPVTPDNPAVAGEQIIVYATGIGLVGPQTSDAAQAITTGYRYGGTAANYPTTPVDDALAGGRTANVLAAGLKPGLIGVYEVLLELNSDIPTNDFTQLTIAQGFFVSNIVTIPVVNPNPPAQ